MEGSDYVVLLKDKHVFVKANSIYKNLKESLWKTSVTDMAMGQEAAD